MQLIKVKISFYEYNKNAVNAGISFWTWFFNPFTPAYSHVEIGLFIDGKWIYFSSTNRDGAKGTRWIDEDKLFKYPERWDVYDIEVESIEDIKSRADGILGRAYDWAGIAGFAMPFGLINAKLNWYCSEAVYFVLTGSWKRRISPRRLYTYIKNNFNLILAEADNEKSV